MCLRCEVHQNTQRYASAFLILVGFSPLFVHVSLGKVSVWASERIRSFPGGLADCAALRSAQLTLRRPEETIANIQLGFLASDLYAQTLPLQKPSSESWVSPAGGSVRICRSSTARIQVKSLGRILLQILAVRRSPLFIVTRSEKSHVSGEQSFPVHITAEHSFSPRKRKLGRNKQQGKKAAAFWGLGDGQLAFHERALGRGGVCLSSPDTLLMLRLHPLHCGCCSLKESQPREGYWPLRHRARSQNCYFNVLLFQELRQRIHSWGLFGLEVWSLQMRNEVESNWCWM